MRSRLTHLLHDTLPLINAVEQVVRCDRRAAAELQSLPGEGLRVPDDVCEGALAKVLMQLPEPSIQLRIARLGHRAMKVSEETPHRSFIY